MKKLNMKNPLEALREKKEEISKKSPFIRVEIKGKKTIYHTEIVNDLNKFGIHKKKNDKFFIGFRTLLDPYKIYGLTLFSLKDNDKFLGIQYGCRKPPIMKISKKYEENGTQFEIILSKIYHMEFIFKTGSIFCYISGLSRLLKKEKFKTNYNIVLFKLIKTLEEEVYRFYNKKLTKKGIISKWIEENAK
ncbi:DUF226 domain-containing protein [Borreliella bissettiae]|uniref:DUF226 domain-containing protein n=2 Tax=Borrelia bissettiae TaxID=64897 RepID=UPI0038B250A4